MRRTLVLKLRCHRGGRVGRNAGNCTPLGCQYGELTRYTHTLQGSTLISTYLCPNLGVFHPSLRLLFSLPHTKTPSGLNTGPPFSKCRGRDYV